MTTQERDNILAEIAKLKKLNFIEIIYSNGIKPNSEDILIGDLTIANAAKLWDRAIIQIEQELRSDNYFILPASSMQNQSVTRIHLQNTISSLETFITSKDYTRLYKSLMDLISYQVSWGFWDKSERKLHAPDELKFKELQNELTISIKKLNKNISESDKLISTLSKLIEEKNQEFESLSSKLNNANKESEDIKNLWERATRLNGEIATIQSSTKEALENINNQIKLQKEEFSILKSSIEQKELKINTTLNEAKSSTEIIKESETEIKDKIEEATRLLGLSADAALGGKFSKREIKITKALVWWRVAVILSVVLAIVWAVIVFLCLSIRTDQPYLDFLINIIKTSPGFILMGYIMSQYNKERAIEEEYAFRAAISETINAYADLLANQDDSDKSNDSRQKMLLSAIRQVYAKPVMQKDNISASVYKSQTRELLDVLKQIKLPNK
jgi:hypothetical protein